MLKDIFKLLKKVVFAALIIYAYNVLALPLALSIPINMITIIFVSIFDFSGLFGLILFKYLFF